MKPKRPREDMSIADMHEEYKKWAGESHNQMQLELSARQIDATKSIANSSRRLEVATWILVGTSVVLLVLTLVLIAVTIKP